jgi:peptidoglycan/LPS O-acetylase OafA/YrhL
VALDHDGLPALRAVAERIERSRERALGTNDSEHEVPTDIAVVVVIIGALSSVVGWTIAPATRRTDAAENWYALITSTLFWSSAFVAAIGLYLRRRRGLLAALVCAMTFLGAVVIGAVLDTTVIGARWGVELACAACFMLASAGALLVTTLASPQSAPRSQHREAAHRPLP